MGIENVTQGVASLMTMTSTMIDTILANPVLAVLFSVSFVSITIGIVRSLKRT